MPQPQVSIIGAGLAGVVLGRCLLQRGIRAILYERDALKPRHGYGITLRSSAYRQLLPILNLDETTFIRKAAVDGPVGGQRADSSYDREDPSFRANRQRFEALLGEGLDIRWEQKLKGIKCNANSLILEFENDEKAETSLVIGADGVHSQIRKIISPSTDFNILPFAVFNGKRRLDPTAFEKTYEPYLRISTAISHKSSNALLQISLNEKTEEKASISYTYSRPGKESNDALFKPRRPKEAATDITPDFFDEVCGLRELEEPFGSVFTSEKMQDDRLLNWLMRSILVPQQDLMDAAGRGIVLLGDSVHHGPILGSDGANEAIEDAIALAEYIASDKDLHGYYGDRYSLWTRSVSAGEARLSEMHKQAKSSL